MVVNELDTATFIIDFDSTIIRSETLEELARLALELRPDREAVMAKLQAITHQGMAGSLPFEESLSRRLKLFAAHKDLLDRLTEQLKRAITPSVYRRRAWFRRNADRIYILSGGFEECVVPVVATLGIAPDHVLANRFEFDASGNITGYDRSRHTGRSGGKIRQIAELKLSRPIIVIGDGYTDYEIRAAGEADEFWAFTENIDRPSVTEKADRILASFAEVAGLAGAGVQ